MINKSSLKAKPSLANTQAKSSGAVVSVKSPQSQLPTTLILNPRFTNEEKEILYSLFNQHEDVIDIKNRKKKKGKHSIRIAWQSIVDSFNAHPNISIQRNLKQIQKFWLNSRLRKQYPSKDKKDLKRITTSSEFKNSLPAKRENIDEYEEIEIQRISDSDSVTIEPLEVSIEAVQTQPGNSHQIQQQKHQPTINQGFQQINVDHISADKLTLNDLLQFKSARPQEEIRFQTNKPNGVGGGGGGGGSIILQSSSPITVSHHLCSDNNEIIQLEHYQAPPQIKEQHYSAPNSTYYTYTTQNQPYAPKQSNLENTIDNKAGKSLGLVISDPFEDKFNYFKLKETELRKKEVQLLSEEKRIELYKLQEELRHKKEMHQLQVQEMQIKIRILCEEEKQLRKIKEI